jgi:hypothetical protein
MPNNNQIVNSPFGVTGPFVVSNESVSTFLSSYVHTGRLPQHRWLEAETPREQEETLRERQETLREDADREEALALRCTLPPDLLHTLNLEVAGYYGPAWGIISAFKMDALFERYVGPSPGEEYFVVFVGATPMQSDTIRVCIFRRRRGSQRGQGYRWQRCFTENYQYVTSASPVGITRLLQHLYTDATIRGRSVAITGGQLLMPFALRDASILEALKAQYQPEVAEQERRAKRFKQLCSPVATDVATRTPRGAAAANASRNRNSRRN